MSFLTSNSPPLHSNNSLTLSELFAHTSERSYVQSVLEGEGEWGYFLVKVLILLVGLSTLSFSLDSVESLHEEYHDLFLGIDIFCLLFFTFEYILRLYVSEKKIQYAIQWMSMIDLLSILPSWMNLLFDSTIPRLQFIRILRLFKFLISTKRGHKSAIVFQRSWSENSNLLLASTYLFMSVWIVFSCLQHFAEFDNDDMLHCVPPITKSTGSDDVENDSLDCTCDSNSCFGQSCVCTPRYGSVLSSMYFTLIEFSGTFQLAKSHSTFGRYVAVGTVVMSVGIFAVPTSLFAAALSDAADVLHKNDDSVDDDDEDEVRDLRGGNQSLNIVNDRSIEVIAWQAARGSGVYGADGPVPAFTLSSKYIILSKSLVVLSAGTAICSTLPINTKLTVYLYFIVDVACIAVFGAEYVCRVAAEGPILTVERFFHTLLPTADIVAWLPSLLVYLSGCEMAPPPPVELTVALFRIFKLERYIKGFWIIYRVMKKSWGLLSVGGMATFCILMFTSAMMFYTEKENPDPNVRKYYSSVPQSLWTNMINVSNMAQVDYSLPGRVIAGVLCLFTIAVFAVPIGAIGGGFQNVMNAMAKHETHPQLYQKVEKVQEKRPLRETFRRYGSIGDVSDYKHNSVIPKFDLARLRRHSLQGTGVNNYELVLSEEELTVAKLNENASGKLSNIRKAAIAHVKGNLFMGLSISMTVIGVVLEIVGTCEVFQSSKSWGDIEKVIEFFVIMWFTFEILYRTVAFGSVYVMSKLGFLDLLATVPWYIAHGLLGVKVGVVVDRYDGPLRFVRLMRLMRLDAYAPSLSLIDAAIDDCWDGLKVATFSFAVLWFLFNEWLFLAEHESGHVERNSTPYHFRTALSSLQFSGMLLTNGYNDMDDISLSGQVCCCCAVMVAVGISAVPASVLANSFVSLLRDEAEKDHDQKLKVALLTQRIFRKKRSDRSLAGISRQVTNIQRNSEFSMMLYRHLMGIQKDSWYPSINVILIIVNVMVVMLESVDSLYSQIPSILWISFELFCVLVFTVDYACVLFTIEHNLENKCSRLNYIFSLRGICALCSIMPCWSRIMLLSMFDVDDFFRIPRVIVGFRILRVFRIIGLDRYIKCYYYLSTVLTKVSSILTAAGIVALIFWVGCASLFYYAELGAKDGDVVFESIPESLYFCALFLVGDWQIQDFTPLGAIVCLILSLSGVAIFAVPIGVLFEGFKTVIAEQQTGKNASLHLQI